MSGNTQYLASINTLQSLRWREILVPHPRKQMRQLYVPLCSIKLIEGNLDVIPTQDVYRKDYSYWYAVGVDIYMLREISHIHVGEPRNTSTLFQSDLFYSHISLLYVCVPWKDYICWSSNSLYWLLKLLQEFVHHCHQSDSNLGTVQWEPE